MSADVYDFRTGQLCKCCTSCKFWKGILDFPILEIGKYGRGAVCKECLAEGDESLRPFDQSINRGAFNFTFDIDDDETA